MKGQPIKFYSPKEMAKIKELYAQPASKERRAQIEAYAKSIGRTHLQLQQKASAAGYTKRGTKKKGGYIKKADRVKAPIVRAERNSARTNGTEVRFKFTNMSVDMENQEVVFTIGK